MLNKNNERELAYIVKVDAITPMNADRLECAHVGGWHCVVGKGEFTEGDLAVYFEIDSKLPEVYPFNQMQFLISKHYKIKSQRIRGEVSQGLLVPLSTFIDETGAIPTWLAEINLLLASGTDIINTESRFLTKTLDVTYAVTEDNRRKGSSNNKYKIMAQRHPTLGKTFWWRWLFKRTWGKKLLFFFFGKKRDKGNEWPIGKFPGVSKTDQERVENMTWILQDKSPFIVTQKCDGSSGTYILERKGKNRFEFYVCSRNVRMKNEEQECFYGSHNYYWEVAKKYDIEKKMRAWLNEMPDRNWVCWQGEICAPGIQKNPHNLTETHFYCFHWTDNINGRRDIREAALDWKTLEMETVPIVNENYILPDNFEDLKISADGYYDASICEGNSKCKREGYVYYKSTDPTFSFKYVSREYLLD